MTWLLSEWDASVYFPSLPPQNMEGSGGHLPQELSLAQRATSKAQAIGCCASRNASSPSWNSSAVQELFFHCP